jgi:hypothetical protein
MFQSCKQYSGISRTYRINIDAGCCNTDYCNNKPPSLLHLKQLTNTSVQGILSDTNDCPINSLTCRDNII